MKANQKFLKTLDREDDAVSPVIAVILMVAITVVLAATVYVWVSGFGGNNQKVVNTQLSAVGGDDKITLKHVSGDALAANGWKVSISLTSASATYLCVESSALTAGGQVVFTEETNAACDSTATDLTAGTYQIKVLETATNTVLFDREITVT